MQVLMRDADLRPASNGGSFTVLAYSGLISREQPNSPVASILFLGGIEEFVCYLSKYATRPLLKRLTKHLSVLRIQTSAAQISS